MRRLNGRLHEMGQAPGARERMSEASDWLADQWRGAGVAPGDILLVHSGLKRTFRRLLQQGHRPDATVILESFLSALGPDGTLLLPLFNFDFNAGMPFDIRSTPSQMGALTEAGRVDERAIRTGHPVYSFAVIGAQQDLFATDNFSGYGSDSPFGILHRAGGKIAVLDLPDVHSMTFYHYVEEARQVDYRYHKHFTGPYTDINGNMTERTYGLFVRDVSRGVQTDVNPMGELLWAEGLYRGDRPLEDSGLRTIDARVLFDRVARVIDEGKAEGLLMSIEGV